MIKINLPNPREMSITEFFAQMRIALKSAEKSYEEMVKGVELTENNQPWISFRIENIRDILGGDDQTHQDLYNAIDNFICEDDSQEIYLEIERL
jgi:hypothetical protein